MAEDAAGCHREVACGVFVQVPRQPCDPGEVLDPFEEKQHQLTPVADDNLQLGEAVEYTRDHHPEEFHAGVVVPAHAEGRESGLDSRPEPRVVGVPHRRRRRLRVQVQRRAPPLGHFIDWPQVGVVQVLRAGAAEDHRSIEPEAGKGALELLRGRARRAGWKGRQSLEAVRSCPDGRREQVVSPLGERNRLPRRQVLYPWCGQREHLDAEPGRVHRRDPLRPEFQQPAPGVAFGRGAESQVTTIGRQLSPGLQQTGDDEVFLKSDDPHRAHESSNSGTNTSSIFHCRADRPCS